MEEKNISEILNLIGYGVAKFDLNFVKEFGFRTKTSFYEYLVVNNLAKSVKAISNRQDSFDPYFDNGRKGWWQRNQREHVKLFIDSLFGKENAKGFANIVKLYILEFDNRIDIKAEKITPITKSKFKQLQETGNEAEFYFIQNFHKVTFFENGIIEDARLWGDGYDFQIQLQDDYVLSEVKGVRQNSGSIRLTENEYFKAKEFKDKYFLVVVSNLSNTPTMSIIQNPIPKLSLTLTESSSISRTYHTSTIKW